MDDFIGIVGVCALAGIWRGRCRAVRPGQLVDDLAGAAGVLALALVAAWAWGQADSASGLAWLALVPLGAVQAGEAIGWTLARLAQELLP